MKTKQQLAEDYANNTRPIEGLDKHDAPFLTAFEHHEDVSDAFIAGYEAAQQWIPVTPETMPKTKEAVNVIAVTDNGKRYRTIAYFIPEKTVLASGFFDDCCGDLEVYDEEIDEYWVAEGWFEWQSVSEIHYHISDRITHYLPIPKLPTE